MKTLRLALLALVITVSGCAQNPDETESVTLVDDGLAKAVIVLPDNADENEQSAADELVNYVEKISGASLPILVAGRDSLPKDSLPILIGSAATDAGAITASDIVQAKGDRQNLLYPPDGFVLRVAPTVVALSGVRSDGTLFAAYEMLERLGCRWFFPGQLGEVIPQSKTVKLKACKTVQRPSLESRQIRFTGEVAADVPNHNGDTHQARTQWLRRNRLSLEADDPDRLWQYISFEDPDDPAELDRPVNRATDFFTDNPHKTWFSMCWADSNAKVTEDQALGIHHPWDKRYNATDAVIAFTNKAARKVAQQFPGRNINILAYMNYMIPPVSVKPDPSLGIYVTPIEACRRHVAGTGQCWQRDAVMQTVKTWCELSDKVSVYDYEPAFLVDGGVPMPCVSRLRVELPLMHKYGLRSYHSQTQLSIMNTGPNMYIRSRLFWNVNCNVDVLLDEYYSRLFGPSAGHVRKYWDALEYMFHNGPGHQHEDELLKTVYPIEKVRKLLPHIKAAEKAADTDLIRRRVQMIRFSFDNLMLYLQMRQAEDQADFANARQLAERMLDLHYRIEATDPVFYKIGDLDRATEDHAHMTGGWIAQNKARLERTDSTVGELVAMLPDKWQFKTDPHDQGIIFRWFQSAQSTDRWDEIRTSRVWEVQGYEDKVGHGYDGVAWYRTTVKIPAKFADRPVKLNFGGVFGKMLIWVNGEFVTYRPFKLPWWLGNGYNTTFDIDLSSAIEPGRDNTIVIRVDNEFEWGGIFRRIFLWSPTSAQ